MLVFVRLGGALEIRVIDTQYENAALPLGEQPVEQAGADIADMQLARRRRRKTDFGRLCGHRGISQF